MGTITMLLTLGALVRQVEDALPQLTHLQNERVDSLQTDNGEVSGFEVGTQAMTRQRSVPYLEHNVFRLELSDCLHVVVKA